jgi:hypothetical protein
MSKLVKTTMVSLVIAASGAMPLFAEAATSSNSMESTIYLGTLTETVTLTAAEERRAARRETAENRRYSRRDQDDTSTVPESTPDPESDVEFKAPPQGIYHSAGFIASNNERNTIVKEAIDGQDYVSGSLVRVGWQVLNPTEGEYDFSAIERELEEAASYNTSISLAVLDSLELPQYLLEQCEVFSYSFRGQEIDTCLPWDSTYQAFKNELVTKLGEAFDSHANLGGVYFTYSAMSNGVEMHWRVDEDEYAAAGYTSAVLEQSYNDVMDMYNAAFPSTAVIMEVHEVFGESHLAQSAFDHCYETMGTRCGVAIWWCASRMATDPKQSEYSVYNIAQQATELSFAVCQTIGNFTNQANRFDQGLGWTSEEALRNELDFFVAEGFKNFEIWSVDIQNEALVDIITDEYLEAIE